MVATVAGIHGGLDIHANRPAGNAVPDGSLYSCSTHSLIYKSNFAGNSWATYATLGASTPTFSGAGAYNSADLALSTAGEAAITMNSESYDVGAYHSTVSNTSRLTVPTTGYYIWTVNIRLSANVNTYLAVRKNGAAGTILGISSQTVNNTSTVLGITMSNVVSLSSTDYIEMYAAADAAVNAKAAGAGPAPWFAISLLGV